MSSLEAYTLLVVLVALERAVELVVSRRHAAWALAQGGREAGRGHYPVMVALHTALLLGCVAEPWALERPFVAALGWPMLALVVAAQALRWWCVRSLGRRWTTRVLVLPGRPRVTGGPYRWLRHPNYVAVVVEGLALPLVHTAWLTAAVFTALNAALLSVRIRCEDAALAEAEADGGAPEQAASGPPGAEVDSYGVQASAPARPARGSRRTHHTDDL